MRSKLLIATTAGALTLTGLAVAVPALADTGTPGTAASSVADRIRDALSGLVDDGSLTPEQADEVATTLGDAGPGGHGGHGGGRLALDAAAAALDMTEDELRTALGADGATLASIAEERGVPVEDLVAALTDAAEARIAEAVEDGRLTQAEADERLADLAERIADRVESPGPGSGWPGRDRPGPGD